jgi:isopenicillin N synthase-like dioxygenase
LSKEEKDRLHIRHNELFRGWEPAGATNTYDGIDEGDDAGGETKEGFNWGYEDRLDSEGGDGKFVELDGRRPGPGRENVWPGDEALPGFYEGVREYYGRVLGLARHLFRLFALSLDLEEGYFDKMATHPGGIGRLLWYPAQETRSVGGGEQEKHKLGLGAHTDYECFTLLLTSSNPGLEILFPASTPSAPSSLSTPTWIPCPVRPGTLTVNVADFLMRWTNGRYKSTVHRVVNRSETMERYSVPVFFSINYDSVVETLPGCEEGDLPGGYKPIKAGEYVLERLRATSIE